MTYAEFIAQGTYRDFILVDNTVFILPLGFEPEVQPLEVSAIKTMASGKKRRDLVRQSWKINFSWSTAPQSAVDLLRDLYLSSLEAAAITVYLRKEAPANGSDYDSYPMDIVNPVKAKSKARPARFFVYQGVTLELE